MSNSNRYTGCSWLISNLTRNSPNITTLSTIVALGNMLHFLFSWVFLSGNIFWKLFFFVLKIIMWLLLLHVHNVMFIIIVKSLSRVRLFATPWTVAHQAPRSMGLSRHEYWSGLPFPFPIFTLNFNYFLLWLSFKMTSFLPYIYTNSTEPFQDISQTKFLMVFILA